MAEKDQIYNSNTSGALLSGGPLAVENTSVVSNKGTPYDVSKNASISTFSQSILTNYLKYPTILFEGSISSSTPVGANVYSTVVSPALLKSTSLSRIANFATNFRQWNGAMTARLIFTKPIFVQTKVIAAYIPGATEAEIETLTIADMYGAQYHSVMNPDNDNELSFKIPFISGRNWLPMSTSSGLFVVKLFQPLIASQPTNVANVTVPFTITISSNDDMTDEAKLLPLDFRYLVAPTYQNQVIKKDFQEVIINSISPQIPSAQTNQYSAIVPRDQFESNRARSMVLLPTTKLERYFDQVYERQIDADKFIGDFRKSPCSLDSTQDLLFSNTSNFYVLPLDYEVYNRQPMNVINGETYDDLTPSYNLGISNSYAFASQGTAVRLLINTSLSTAPVGQYFATMVSFTNKPNNDPSGMVGNVRVTVTHLSNGTYNYFVESTDLYGTVGPATEIDPDLNFYCRFSQTLPVGFTYKQELLEMKNLVSADKFDGTQTHALFYSTTSKADTEIDMLNDNYVNLTPASQDLMSASYSDRAISSAELLSDDDSGIERVNFVQLLMALKIGSDFIAKAARITSNVLSYIIPILKINGKAVGPNQTVVLDLFSSDVVSLSRNDDNRSIYGYPEVTNPNVSVLTSL